MVRTLLGLTISSMRVIAAINLDVENKRCGRGVLRTEKAKLSSIEGENNGQEK